MTRPRALIVVTVLSLGAWASAQTPIGLHATWTPNAAGDNVTNYLLSVDGGPTVVVNPAMACDATVCTVPFTVASVGTHSVSLVAQNFLLEGDSSTLQSSEPTTATFTVRTPPGNPKNIKIGK